MLTLRKAPKSRFRPYSKRPFLRLVDLDELHCVMTWGDSFRPAYRSLHVLRNRIQRNIPWFGASATLWPDILNFKVSRVLKGTHIIYESLNRDNIYPRPSVCFHESVRETKDRKSVV